MIAAVRASQRLDSRGNPTVQAEVVINLGMTLLELMTPSSPMLMSSPGRFHALVPSGASTGKHEAVELRDKDEAAYRGKGVQKAVTNVQTIIGPALMEKGFDTRSQLKEIDQFMRELDGTANKARLGANAILGVSMACARAGAASMVG